MEVSRQVKVRNNTMDTSEVVKESNPVDVADSMNSKSIANEPDFAWWVLYTLRKKDSIIYTVNSREIKRNHKYGL